MKGTAADDTLQRKDDRRARNAPPSVQQKKRETRMREERGPLLLQPATIKADGDAVTRVE